MAQLSIEKGKLWKMLSWYFAEKALPPNQTVHGRRKARNHLKYIRENINPKLEIKIEKLLVKSDILTS